MSPRLALGALVLLLLLLVSAALGAAVWLARERSLGRLRALQMRRNVALRARLDRTVGRRSFDTLFDKVLVVALAERRTYIARALGSFGVRFDVVDPVLKSTLVPAEHMASGAKPLYAGKVACHLSHLKALRQFLADTRAQTCVVFEDDLKSCLDKTLFERRVATLADELHRRKGKWDILYLGRCHDSCMRLRYVTPQLADNARPLCRHAYAVTRSGAETILAETYPMRGMPGDHMYRTLIRDGRLRALVVEPVLFSQNRETLGTTLQNHGRPVVCSDQPNDADFAADPINRITEVLATTGAPLQKTRSFLVNEQLEAAQVRHGATLPKNAYALVRLARDPLPHRLVAAMADRLHASDGRESQAVRNSANGEIVAVLVPSAAAARAVGGGGDSNSDGGGMTALLASSYQHDLVPS